MDDPVVASMGQKLAALEVEKQRLLGRYDRKAS